MNADKDKILLKSDLTDKIIKAFYDVYNCLGFGFLEKVYENALAAELEDRSLLVEKQKPISVLYKNRVVGEYYADLCVENTVIIELKSCETVVPAHEAQLFNYLKATDIEIGLLLNFGRKPEVRRKIHTEKTKNQ